MAHADISILRDRVSDVARSEIGSRFGDVILEDRDEDGDNLLRVLVEVRELEGMDETKLETLLTKIESVVNELDDRFPSVRFADAA